MMRDFAKETEKMGMQQEMMNDAFEMCADPEEDGQAEDVYAQILGEIGMAQGAEMATGSGGLANPAAAQQEVSRPCLCLVHL